MIDVEIARRKLLESTPIACRNEEVVNFDTAEIPWWAWVRRFHLPEVSGGGWRPMAQAARVRRCWPGCMGAV